MNFENLFVFLTLLSYNQHPLRGVAQFGSALDWGSRGRWFKSSRPDLHGIAGFNRICTFSIILIFAGSFSRTGGTANVYSISFLKEAK